MRVWKQTVQYVLAAVMLSLLWPAVSFAAQSQSSHYQVSEVFFGSGGALNACSTSYCSKQSAGEVTVGNTSSANYQAQGGFNTDRQPYIQMDVSTTNIDLGTLTPTTTKVATASFTVEAYLAHGYVVTNASPPPTNNAYSIHGLTTPTASAAGTEQFGMNLTANTIPATFGANPSDQPDSTFSYGEATSDYSNPNLYKYVQGDTIAESLRSTSYTTYTISYIFNISNVTPGGTYTFNHVLVATATY
jgi:hypothetical protein